MSTGSAFFVFGSSFNRVGRSTIARQLSCRTTRTSLFACFSSSSFSFTRLLLCDLPVVLFNSTPLPRLTHSLTTACKKSFFANSLTKITSGAYGLVPPNANLALTSSPAACLTFAVRSTTATTGECGSEISSFVLGHRTSDTVCLTVKALLKSSSSVIGDDVIANVSMDNAERSVRRSRFGIARKLFSN